MKDSQSNEVKQGDYFAYAVRDGNHSAMNFGRVLEVSDDRIKAVTATRHYSDGWKVAQRSQSLADSSRLLVISPKSMDVVLRQSIDTAAKARGF